MLWISLFGYDMIKLPSRFEAQEVKIGCQWQLRSDYQKLWRWKVYT